MIKFLSTYINAGHTRTVAAKKNVAALIIIKGVGILISLILVPLTINYINSSTYGIWLTISSIIAWLSFFNIGLNNGLRNKFAEAKANNDLELAKRYVSTTYALLTLIFIPLLLVFIIANQWLDWSKILNVSHEMNRELAIVSLIIVGYFCLKFILSTVNIILLADQKPAGEALRSLVEQLVSLIIIYVLIKLTKGSLLYLSLALCLGPLAVLVYFNIALFSNRYKSVRPQISSIDFHLSKDLLGLGMKFFIIQIAGIIQFQTSNFIIIKYFGPDDVTAYNIAFKYFGVLMMGMGVIVAPLWSAVTEAYTQRDRSWIMAAVKRYFSLALVLGLVGVIMLLGSSKIYDLWIGEGVVDISFSISFCMLIFAFLNMIGSIYVGVLNGIGALKIQSIVSMLSPVIFILLVFLFVRVLKWGVYSVIIASVLANFNAYIIAPIQYNQIFKRNKWNIWIE